MKKKWWLCFVPFLCLAPRILFEEWSYHDFETVFGSEDEIEELSNTMIQIAKVKSYPLELKKP